MSVELINHNPSEVLDLTGGNDADDNKDPSGAIAEGGEAADEEVNPTDGDDVDGGDTDGSDELGEPEAKAEEEAPAEEADEESDAEYFIGDMPVDVTVPDEISSALKDAGIDSKELLGELFAKDGNFELSEGMRRKLEEKFGKHMVDGYLNMYKGMNDQALANHAASTEAEAKLLSEQQGAYSEAVGGAEGIEGMESYILDNFNDEQISAYNAVMENGDFDSQMLIISQVQQMRTLQDKLANGDTNITLEADKSQPVKEQGPMAKGYLTKEEYDQITRYDNDEYWDDKDYMSKVDAARAAGFNR